LSLASFSKDAYNISITIKGYKSKKCYLGYYFGDKQYLKDSAITDINGRMVFHGKESLDGGVYLIASANKSLLFDFVVTEQFFSLDTDSSDMIGNMKVKGSQENEIFFGYSRFTITIGQKASKLEKEIEEARKSNDTATARKSTEQLRVHLKELADYRKDVVTKHPNTMLSKIFRIMTDVDVPPAPKLPNGNTDSTFQYRYYYDHFFDNFDWADNRIVRTPVFHQKLETFMTKMTYQVPDSINKSADIVLKKAEAGKDNFKYCLFWITNHYETSEFMGMEAVFVHMCDNYYAKGKAFWVDETNLFKMKDQADKWRHNLIGIKASNLTMMDTAGIYHSLANMNAKYTVVIFWNATCGRCKEELPRLINLYDSLNRTNKGMRKFIDVYSVSLTENPNDWLNYLREHKPGWTDVYDPNNETNFRRLYDVSSTPVVYLLDEKKNILAKRLAIEQLRDFIINLEKDKTP
jgi:thiol-disulfide isomerase/thioredoxin